MASTYFAIENFLRSNLSIASIMQYYLIALMILGIQVPPDQTEGLLQLSPHPPKASTPTDYAFDKWALEISGIAFTTKQSAVLVNSFGPIAYCKNPCGSKV